MEKASEWPRGEREGKETRSLQISIDFRSKKESVSHSHSTLIHVRS